MTTFFVTGTGTDVGKTLVACALLAKARSLGLTTLGLKPVASGCHATPQGLRNADALALQAQSCPGLAYARINPMAFAPPIAPHLAARQAGQDMTLDALVQALAPGLAEPRDLTLIEGAGGWRVPLNDGEDLAGLATRLALPVILVVGLELGCLNQARLTAEGIRADGLPLAGWVGNLLDAAFAADETIYRANLATLDRHLPGPCLGVLPRLDADTFEALARELVRITPPGLDHVFFSDSGSVGMEVAMKMALQYHHLQGKPEKRRLLSLMKAYHGDTLGCMAVCDPEEGMHALFTDALPRHHFAPAPRAGFDAEPAAVQTDLDGLRRVLERHHREVAALTMEPLLQAAGGLNMVSPHYLRGARALCDDFDILLILDEVATGFGRIGRLFAAEHAGVAPDIMVLSKGLTGGYLGHAATLATGRVHDAFIGDSPLHAFMHGPTFMGNPLACRVALESLAVFEQEDYLGKIAGLNGVLRRELLEDEALRFHPAVADVRVLGATAVIEMRDAACLAGAADHARRQGVWLRPFGRWLYTMPAYVTTEEELYRITDVMKASIGC